MNQFLDSIYRLTSNRPLNFFWQGLHNLGIEIDQEKNEKLTSDIREVGSVNSRVGILVVPTNEELKIALETERVIGLPVQASRVDHGHKFTRGHMPEAAIQLWRLSGTQTGSSWELASLCAGSKGKIVFWMTGTLSPLARNQLNGLGIKVVENVDEKIEFID